MNKLKVLQCLNVMNDEYRRIAETPRNDPGAREFIMAYDELYAALLLEPDITDVISSVIIRVVNRRDSCEN